MPSIDWSVPTLGLVGLERSDVTPAVRGLGQCLVGQVLGLGKVSGEHVRLSHQVACVSSIEGVEFLVPPGVGHAPPSGLSHLDHSGNTFTALVTLRQSFRFLTAADAKGPLGRAYGLLRAAIRDRVLSRPESLVPIATSLSPLPCAPGRDADLRSRSPGVFGAHRLIGTATTLDTMHVGGGEAQGWTDLVGHDFDLGTVLTVVGLPTALLDAPGDHDAHPLERLSATFSARSRQQMTSKNDVASCHSLVVWSCQRRLAATPSWPWLDLPWCSGFRVLESGSR
jgi:hypothetical protein